MPAYPMLYAGVRDRRHRGVLPGELRRPEPGPGLQGQRAPPQDRTGPLPDSTRVHDIHMHAGNPSS